MSSVRVANSYLSGALEVAAEYIRNGDRRATNDCVRKTPKVLVVEHRDAGRSRQGLVVENVAGTAAAQAPGERLQSVYSSAC